MRAAVWEAYAEPWRAAYPDLDLDAVWAQVRLAEAVFQMITYENIARAQTPDTRWELSGVVTRTLERAVPRAPRGARGLRRPVRPR